MLTLPFSLKNCYKTLVIQKKYTNPINKFKEEKMFDPLKIIKNGNERQRNAYEAICNLQILRDLKEYSPILCGTLPLNIATLDSDLDIILEVTDLHSFSQKTREKYGNYQEYKSMQKTIRNRQVIVSSFWHQGFEFQLFAQNQPSTKQYAYLHMVIEWHILQEHPEWITIIRELKQKGWKTEPAFCKILRLKGDPFEALIEFGKKQQYI